MFNLRTAASDSLPIGGLRLDFGVLQWSKVVQIGRNSEGNK